MIVAVSSVLLAALLASGTAALGAGPLMNRRRGHRPRPFQVGAIAVSVALVLANAVYVSQPDGGGAHHTLAAGVAMLLGAAAMWSVAGWCAASRHAPRPARLPRRVLAIGAHPDDLELACGGTLVRLVDSGHEVHALVMSHGSVGGNGSAREAEARAGARFVGTTSVDIVDLPDTRLGLHENEMAEAIERTIRRHQPDIVLTHSGNDQHQDHRAVHLATLRAARRHPAILCYESPSVTAGSSPASSSTSRTNSTPRCEPWPRTATSERSHTRTQSRSARWPRSAAPRLGSAKPKASKQSASRS